MKKLNLKYIIFAGSLTLLQVGCKEITDVQPINEISDVDYWKTADQFKLAANEYYTYQRTFQDVISDGPHSELRSDFLTGNSLNPFSTGSNTIPLSDANWDRAYSQLRAINYLLDRSQTYANPAEIALYVAEAKFFRAYVYFDLLQQFGGVPIVEKPLTTNSQELQAPRNSREEVVDFILKDLEEAIPALPLENAIAGVNKGRVSQGAAQAFLGRVGLYEGTWQKFHGGSATRYNALLDKAIAANNAVITSNQYQLFAPAALGDSAYKYMFILENERSNPAGITKAANREYILANKYDLNLRQIRLNITQAVHGNAGTNWPTRTIATMYLSQDGLPIEKSPLFQGFGTPRSEFINRDNRMKYSLMIDGNYYWDNEAPSTRVDWTGNAAERAHSRGRQNNAVGTGYTNQKWATERRLDDQQESYDYPVIRYAEVLLTYAEAVFERNGAISNIDLDKSLNLVRNRANKNMPKLSNELVAANGLDMRTEIRRERNVEFYYEGFRRNDLLRWKLAEVELPKPALGIKWAGTTWETKWNRNTTANPGPAYVPPYPVDANGVLVIEGGRQFNASRNYLLPIPSQQLQLNGNLEQNPGW
jgi:starch-binding outer membrane protein, SusD/RagB family